MQFTEGTFVKLRAANFFNFGPLNGMGIAEGTPIEFDGRTVKMGGGTYNCPQMSIAVRVGWVVPFEDVTSRYVPQASGVQLHAAQATGEKREEITTPTVVNEERVVKKMTSGKTVPQHVTVEEPTRPTQVIQADPPEIVPQRPVPSIKTASGVLDVEEADRINRARLAEVLAQPVKKADLSYGQRHNTVEEGDAPKKAGGKFAVLAMDGQQGTVVGEVRTSSFSAATGSEATKRRVDATKITSTAVESVNEPGGIIRNAAARTFSTGEAIQNVGARVESTSEMIRMSAIPKIASSTVVVAEGNESILATRGGMTGDVVVSSSGEDLADLLPDAVVAGLPNSSSPPTKTREEAIQDILEGWDRSRHWTLRVQEAVDFYGGSPEVLEALYAVESKGVTRQIKAKLEKADKSEKA